MDDEDNIDGDDVDRNDHTVLALCCYVMFNYLLMWNRILCIV